MTEVELKTQNLKLKTPYPLRPFLYPISIGIKENS